MPPPVHISTHVFHRHRARRATRNELEDCFGDAPGLSAKLGDGDGFAVGNAQKRSESHELTREPVFAVDDGVIRLDADAHFHFIGTDETATLRIFPLRNHLCGTGGIVS